MRTANKSGSRHPPEWNQARTRGMLVWEYAELNFVVGDLISYLCFIVRAGAPALAGGILPEAAGER
jgi:hypothetical protein